MGGRAGAGRAADRARLQPARGRRRGGRARRPARGRAGGGRGARDGARRRRRRSECRVPPSRPRLRPRGLRVRLRDPRHRGRRRAHERRRLRQRLEGDSRAGARRRRDRRSLVHQRGTRALVPPLRPRPGAGGGRGRVPARRPRRRRDQGDGRRHAVPAKGHAAHQQAHVRKRVQESGPRARGRTDDRALRPEGASHRRGDHLATPRRTSSRTPGERPRARLSNSWPRLASACSTASEWCSSERWSFSASSNCLRWAHLPSNHRRTAAVRGEAKLAWPRASRALLRRRRAVAGPCSC